MARYVRGQEELKRNIKSFKSNTEKRLYDGVFQALVLIQNSAKISHPYRDRTGNLTNSIQAQKPETTRTKIFGFTIAGMEYGVYVELGTGKTKAYPFLFPAAEREKSNIIRLLGNKVKISRFV